MTPLLTLDEAAAYTKLSPRTLQREGNLPRIKIGRCVRFRMEDIRAWLERRQDVVYVPSFTPVAAPKVDGIYYVMSRVRHAEAVKIGFTGNSIHTRIRELGTAHPWPLDLIAFEKFATERDEKSRHHQFASCRIKNAAGTEWFTLSEELKGHIENGAHHLRKLRTHDVVCSAYDHNGADEMSAAFNWVDLPGVVFVPVPERAPILADGSPASQNDSVDLFERVKDVVVRVAREAGFSKAFVSADGTSFMIAGEASRFEDGDAAVDRAFETLAQSPITASVGGLYRVDAPGVGAAYLPIL